MLRASRKVAPPLKVREPSAGRRRHRLEAPSCCEPASAAPPYTPLALSVCLLDAGRVVVAQRPGRAGPGRCFYLPSVVMNRAAARPLIQPNLVAWGRVCVMDGRLHQSAAPFADGAGPSPNQRREGAGSQSGSAGLG